MGDIVIKRVQPFEDFQCKDAKPGRKEVTFTVSDDARHAAHGEAVRARDHRHHAERCDKRLPHQMRASDYRVS